MGPFISGSLFTAATRIRPKGELLPFGIFGGVAFLGFLLSFGIRGGGLEAEGWSESEEEEQPDEEEEAERSGEAEAEGEGDSSNERTRLLRE